MTRQELDQVRITKNLSYRDLSVISGISHSYLSKMFRGLKRGEFKTWETICECLSVPISNARELYYDYEVR